MKCAKCLSVAVWHTGATLDGSTRLAAHYTLCKFQIELAHSWIPDSEFTPCALRVRLPGWKDFPTTSGSACGCTLGHRGDIMSADPEHEGFVGKSCNFPFS